MHVAHIASEAVPFAKTGGLGDVVGALPRAQVQRGERVTVVLPAYRPLPGEEPAGEPTGRTLDVGGLRLAVRRTELDGVRFLLLDAPRLFARPALYGTGDGDYPDNPQRFAALARGAILALAAERPAPDVLHCHDWQAALAPALLGVDPLLGGALVATPTVLTIHNLAFQGSFGEWVMAAADLPPELFHLEALEFFGRVNYLKGGIKTAHALTTVSPTYAREILEPAFGCGLERVLQSRERDLVGILNGIDPERWDPAADAALERPYDAADAAAGKARCRQALAAELELEDDDSPLGGLVSRLTSQKGIDVLAAAVDGLVKAGVRLVVLGCGEPELERLLSAAAGRHPGRVALRLDFDEALAHRIYAGSDLFVMPSRYEPCGIGQLIALRYGALPVVHPTGGLADTVVDADLDPEHGNGFRMEDLSARALVAAVRRAAAVCGDPPRHDAVRRQAMAGDFSWVRAAARYEVLYHQVLDTWGKPVRRRRSR